ncbi:beta-glucan synthesis-associated [Phellopilus nigrolimitatus]|nr:beta-glucan synthesis-associated [Phellopilus nigrolimitatus]
MSDQHGNHDSSPPSSDELEHANPRHESPPSPSPTSGVDSPLLAGHTSPTTLRSMSSGYINSPLNPNSVPVPRSRPASRGSTYLLRLASEESAAFAGGGGQRGSMLLYRMASAAEDDQTLAAPDNRFSIGSESVLSFNNKYPTATLRGMVPYVYDPELDDNGNLLDADDELHRIDDPKFSWSWRGIANFGLLFILIGALLSLFVMYPVLYALENNKKNLAIDDNIHINGTGQAPVLFQTPELIDAATPDSVKTHTGFDGNQYNLVFSDEFNTDGRTFYPGDDPYWEAVDLWYGATADLEWYDPANAFTRGGNLVLLIESVSDVTDNHELQYRSGMVQSWNKFCFTSGYLEVSLSLPGPNDETQGYWPGVWTMGNLGRPGYGATTDGMWPYTYDSCDVGTFPNQTYANGSGPASALHTDSGRAKYNFELSWLTGQRASACTCDGGDHPGPSTSKGRGAPEIDVLEAQKNKLGDGGKVSQSAQLAPFSHNYLYDNSTTDNFFIQDTTITQPNSYLGSAVQQAVSGLTDLPTDIFNGSGGNFYTFGFEYWTDPNNPDQGYIIWVADGKETIRMGANSINADPLPDGTGVGRRLIPEEPMSIILNLAISESFQVVDTSTMTFPNEMHIDYVRVYQRDGETNVGCSPEKYPTAEYITNHLEAYSNPNLTTWESAGYTKPKNSLYDGC